MIQTRGPQLIESLTDRYVSETVGIIDEYVERVTDSLRNQVGSTCTGTEGVPEIKLCS